MILIMMTAKEMKAYRDEKFQNLYRDSKYQSLLEYIEQKMISSIDKNPTVDMFTFYLPNEISTAIILYMLEEYGYETDYNDGENIIRIYIK